MCYRRSCPPASVRKLECAEHKKWGCGGGFVWLVMVVMMMMMIMMMMMTMTMMTMVFSGWCCCCDDDVVVKVLWWWWCQKMVMGKRWLWRSMLATFFMCLSRWCLSCWCLGGLSIVFWWSLVSWWPFGGVSVVSWHSSVMFWVFCPCLGGVPGGVFVVLKEWYLFD